MMSRERNVWRIFLIPQPVVELNVMAVADAWIAAAAMELDAVLIHKDPEFEHVAGLRQESLPYK